MRRIRVRQAEQHFVTFGGICNSLMIGSRISGESSKRRGGRFRNRFTLSFGLGQVGKGQCVYLDFTDLHWHVLQTRAPGGIASSGMPYCIPRPRSSGRVRGHISALHTKQECSAPPLSLPSCAMPSSLDPSMSIRRFFASLGSRSSLRRLSFTPSLLLTTLATTEPNVISLMMMSANEVAVAFFGVLVLLNITAFGCCGRGCCKCVDWGCELGGNVEDEMIPPGAAAVSVTGTDPPWAKVIPPPAPVTELGIVEMMLFTLALTLLLLLL